MLMSWFTIAVIFFAVTAALAVGPLFVWRLFLGADGAGSVDRRTYSVVPVLLTVGTILVAVAATVSTGRVSTNRQAAGVTEAAPAAQTVTATAAADPLSAERSLFESGVAHSQPNQLSPPRTVRPTVLAILLPLIVVFGILAFAGGRRHVFRLVPVAVAALFVGILYLGTWRNHEVLREATLQNAAVANSADQFAQQQAAAREHQHGEWLAHEIHVVSTTESDSASGTETIDKESNALATTPEESESTDVPPPVTEYVAKELFGVPRETLPEWTTSNADESTIRVIQSGKHATVEAAEREVLAQLRDLLRKEFVHKHREARGWVPSKDVVLNSGSLLRRAVTRSQIEVGNHAIPMYEAYWQVDTSVVEPLYQAWRPAVVKVRLGWLGAGVGLLTLLFGSLAAVLRVDEQTGGGRRKVLAAGTLAMWAAIGSALLLVS